MTVSLPDFGHFDEHLGMWVRTVCKPNPQPKAALFLDRDGVIVEDPGYLSEVGQLRVIPGAAAFVAQANRRGIPVIEVTNQAGIGRGYYGWTEFVNVEVALSARLAAAGAAVDAVFACPFHPRGISGWAHPDHPARKPGSGMLIAAARLLNLDLSHSWIVGDKKSDLHAGHNARLSGAFHVLTGRGREERQEILNWNPEDFQVRLGDSISDASALFDLLQ